MTWVNERGRDPATHSPHGEGVGPPPRLFLGTTCEFSEEGTSRERDDRKKGQEPLLDRGRALIG